MPARSRFALLLFFTLVFSLKLPWVDQWFRSFAEDRQPAPAATAATSIEKAAVPDPAQAKLVNALNKPAPETPEDLAAIQTAIEQVVAKCEPVTVAVDINGVEGSGVIVTEDGYVLTAGHVSGPANRDAWVILPDGKRLRAKTLGANESMDAGMMKITEPGPWPHAEMARSAALKPGEWCVALGHPGGYQRNRPPPVRAGRIIMARTDALWTDCPLMAGDSGGPLFDSQGRLIGIHSRISDPVIANYHVPIDTYRDTWDRLAKGETWGGDPPRGGPMLGISGESHNDGCQIVNVFSGSAAEKGGLRIDDIVTRVNGDEVKGIDGLQTLIAKHKVGEEVTLSVIRGDQKLELKIKLARRD